MSENLSAEEALAHKHRNEKRDLQATIQSLKKTITKGDKKKKKDVQDQIAKLEADLKQRHDAEIKDLDKNVPAETIDNEVVEEIKDLEISNSSKLTKAQKRRNKKDSANQERNARIAEQELINQHGPRKAESDKIKEQLVKKGLIVFDIPSDGDCLYNAVIHGLKKFSQFITLPELRQKVADYLRKHKEQYQPFLTDPTSGEELNDSQYASYCDKVEKTKQWGGQIELEAITHVAKKAIVVIQGSGPELHMGDEYAKEGIVTLTYHRLLYELGEHYNSVQTKPDEDGDDF